MDQVVKDPFQLLHTNGLSISQTNKNTEKGTEELYKIAFEKGVPMYYRDERTNAEDQYIRANPDGSEDLVKYDFDEDTHELLAKLLSAGKGYWAYILSPGI